MVNHVGGMFGIFFTETQTVTSYQDVVKCDVERFASFFHLMLEEGVYRRRLLLKLVLCPWRTAKRISITPSTRRVRCLRSCKHVRRDALTAALSHRRGSKP